jgi:signal peptidase I
MKKNVAAILILLSIGVFCIIGIVIIRLTHVIDIYTFATTSNMPTHAVGDTFFASRLKNPDYGSFVCFKSPIHNIWIHRIIGIPDDIIEIKDAVVYRNGKKLDEPYTWNEYALSKKQYESIAGYIMQNKNNVLLPADSGYSPSGLEYIVSLTNGEIKQYHLNCKKHLLPKDTTAVGMFVAFRNKGYSPDNFGPVKIPVNNYFVMGDNRHDAQDSRYIGFY